MERVNVREMNPGDKFWSKKHKCRVIILKSLPKLMYSCRVEKDGESFNDILHTTDLVKRKPSNS